MGAIQRKTFVAAIVGILPFFIIWPVYLLDSSSYIGSPVLVFEVPVRWGLHVLALEDALATHHTRLTGVFGAMLFMTFGVITQYAYDKRGKVVSYTFLIFLSTFLVLASAILYNRPIQIQIGSLGVMVPRYWGIYIDESPRERFLSDVGAFEKRVIIMDLTASDPFRSSLSIMKITNFEEVWIKELELYSKTPPYGSTFKLTGKLKTYDNYEIIWRKRAVDDLVSTVMLITKINTKIVYSRRPHQDSFSFNPRISIKDDTGNLIMLPLF